MDAQKLLRFAGCSGASRHVCLDIMGEWRAVESKGFSPVGSPPLHKQQPLKLPLAMQIQYVSERLSPIKAKEKGGGCGGGDIQFSLHPLRPSFLSLSLSRSPIAPLPRHTQRRLPPGASSSEGLAQKKSFRSLPLLHNGLWSNNCVMTAQVLAPVLESCATGCSRTHIMGRPTLAAK